MSGESVDSVIISIQNVLVGSPSMPSKPSIFRVDSHLRRGGWDNVYDPEILAIGPYHHGNSRLQNIQQLKYRYLKRLLKRRNEHSVDRYVTAVAGMEIRARKCYAEPFNLNENAFVTLMVLDGVFLIELFRCFCFKNLRDADDPIFRHERILSQLRHDILLLENQLPYFVLNQLFNMTKTNENPDNNNNNDDLITLAIRFFDGMLLNLSAASRFLEKFPVRNIDHLCGLMHDVWCLPFAETISTVNGKRGDKFDNINSISGLWEAGIKFRKGKGNDNLMDIRFENGVLRIPQLSIFDETESHLRNLIAYEQYLPDGEFRYVSDYTFFMHCLITTSNDVQLLRSRGIIENCLGQDEEVCLMFNRLGRNILTSSGFCYSQVFSSVNRHCHRRAKKWKAHLCRKYFSSPWSIMSFLGAVALLVFTFTQTIYTVLTYYNRTR